jgi:hypothetical protein
MSTMTLSGREAPSTKRIDVEANLLQEWLIERKDTKKNIQLRLVGIVAIACAGVWGISTLSTMKAGINKSAAGTAQRLKAVQAQFAEVTPAAGDNSAADIQKMVETAKKNGDAFMGQTVALLNTVSEQMALSGLKVDVLGGEVKLSGAADAETYYAANEFIQHNNDPAKGMTATQVTTSRSDTLAMDGVSFQFVKKVRVAQ